MLYCNFTVAGERYVVSCDKNLIQLSYDSLLTQIGIRETGNNGGAVLKYQKIFGLRNQPYCAMGQYWCFWVNAIDKETMPFPKSALAQSYFNYGSKFGYKTAYVPAVHDLIIWGVKGKSTGHIERIIGISKNGFVFTVGFNTGSGDQREGNGCFKRLRHIYNPIGLLIIKGLVGLDPIETHKEGCNYD